MEIKKIQKNLSSNMLSYTFLAMLLGVVLGSIIDLKFLSKYLLIIIFIMIYPMMINLSLSSLKKIKHSLKSLFEAVFLNFILSPILMYFLLSIFIDDYKIKLALMLLPIAPASSMGLGYIGIAEGNLITGSIIVAGAFILSIFVYPVAGFFLSNGSGLEVSPLLILKNLFVILIVPLVLGIISREYIERVHNKEKFLKLKPYFGTITLLFLYILMFVIFASKSHLIISNYLNILKLLPLAFLYYSILVFLVLFFNKNVFKFEYGNHQSVVFTSVSKNIALTIAILISVFGKEGEYLAVFPAIMILFQAPFLMFYLKHSKKIRKYFNH